MTINQTNDEGKKEVAEFAKSVISTTFFSIAIISAVFAFVFSKRQIALGIIAGGLLSITNFFFMSRNALKMFDITSEQDSKKNTVGGFFLRYAFLIMGLFFLFSSTNVNIISTLISLFSIQIIIYITNIWQIKFQGNSNDN